MFLLYGFVMLSFLVYHSLLPFMSHNIPVVSFFAAQRPLKDMKFVFVALDVFFGVYLYYVHSHLHFVHAEFFLTLWHFIFINISIIFSLFQALFMYYCCNQYIHMTEWYTDSDILYSGAQLLFIEGQWRHLMC